MFAAVVSVAQVSCGGPAAKPPTADGAPATGEDAGADMVTSAVPKCGATPTQLVDFEVLASQTGTSFIGAMQLALDGTNVYFVFGDQLMRVPIRGGVASGSQLSLDPNGFGNHDPVATPSAVVLHYPIPGGDDERIVAVPLRGGAETVLATSHGPVWSLTADPNSAYFADSNGIQSVPLAGGDVQLLTAETSQEIEAATGRAAEVVGLVVVGSNVIAASTARDGEVLSVPIQGGPLTVLETEQPGASFPMPCGADICWWTGAGANPMTGPLGPGYIARLADGAVTMIGAPVYPWSVAFDGSSFFETVGCDACPGTLVRIPASGAPPATVGDAGFVAVDDQCLYFSVLFGDSTLPTQNDAGYSGTGIYSVVKSYMAP